MAERRREIVTTAPPGLELRWIEERDLPFLAELYASTRREEVARTGWSEEERERFLAWQFEAQHKHYREHYPECEFLVIEEKALGRTVPVGRLYLDRWEEEIRLVDVALLPEHRGKGPDCRVRPGATTPPPGKPDYFDLPPREG